MRKLLIYTAVLSFIFTSCSKDLTEKFNVDTKSPEAVPAGMLFANAQKDMARYLASPNVNDNTMKLWAQHWTQTTYTDESNYELTERNINGRTFNKLYADVLRDLMEARNGVEIDEFATEGEKNTQNAMIDVMEVFTYQTLVDVFNDVPYSEAIQLVDNLAPAYDDAESIYRDLISRLDKDIEVLGGGASGAFAGYDLIYGGDVGAWTSFAHSIKLRMAIRMADVDDASARTWATEAIDGAFSSSADDARFYFESSAPNTNPLWEDLVQSGRTDYIASKTLADAMNSTMDPRRSAFFRNLGSDSASGDMNVVLGNPHGAGGSYANFSQPSDMLENPTLNSPYITFTEVEFLRADAAARWGIGGSASDHFNNAVAASTSEWGTPVTSADSMFSATVDYDAQLSAGKTWKEVIGTQKWIAMYNQGNEAWNTWKLYDFPVMAVAAEAGTTPPTRYNYSVDEYSVNGSNASAANGGSDDRFDKVFWDVN